VRDLFAQFPILHRGYQTLQYDWTFGVFGGGSGQDMAITALFNGCHMIMWLGYSAVI
jgi:hypothetical protein